MMNSSSRLYMRRHCEARYSWLALSRHERTATNDRAAPSSKGSSRES